nr:hypothetical protein [Tanacetum cinerariifolium]GEZ76273.1 hypothetical protein [Tanacetum cinerariifolium]
MTPATISSGLVQKYSSSTPYVPPSRNDWDLLFQPMFDELLNPPPSVDLQAPEVIAPIANVIPSVQAESTGSPSSTTVDQDAPFPSKSQTTPETQSYVIPQDVKEDIHDIEVAHMRNDPLFCVPIPKVTSAQSSSTVSPHIIVQSDHQIPQHISKWTKDHPLHNIIGQLSRLVFTRLQLHEQALFCCYDAFLTLVEPKMYKDAMIQSCWIEAMHEELNKFERLEGLVKGIPKLKFKKDHLCSACAMGKSKKKSRKPKSEDTNQEKLYLPHMDLCGPMRVESVNRKKYILVIVDDYSQFTWFKCLRSKDEAPDFIIKFLKMIQVRLKVPVRRIQTDNGTETVSLKDVIVIEAARTMLIYAQALLFLCENLEKLQPKADIGIFIGYAPIKKGPALNEMTPATISSGLVQKSSSSTPYVPPSRNGWDLLFQLMFDELLNPSPSVDPQALEVISLIANVIPLVQTESTDSPSSTTVDQDAHSPSKSQTTPKIQSSVIPLDVEKDIHDIKVTHIGNDPLFGVRIPEVTSAQSSSMKYVFESCDPVDTPMVLKSKLDEDKEGKVIDPSHYRSMIGTLLYPTASRPDL